MKNYKLFFVVISIILFGSCNQKENTGQKKVVENQYKAIDSITTSLLKIVSGDAGEVRDWAKFQNLFKPYAQLTAISHRQNAVNAVNFTLDEFIELADRNSQKHSFQEIELHENIELFGNIAHVFQVYVSKSGNEKNSHRGINSYQLVYDNGRWWIVSITWDIETPKNRIPSKFLGTDKKEILPS